MTDWELVYSDSFDRDAPPSTQGRGNDLIAGLVALWARYLFETIHDGQVGFSHFTLLALKRHIVIGGDPAVAQRMKTWVFGTTTTTTRALLDEADRDLLDAIARAHARELASDDDSNLFLAARYCEPIFRAAAASSSAAAFRAALA